MFNVFTTPEGCTAYAGDKLLTDPEAGETYSLMTIAKESVTAAGDRNGYTTVSHDSYVVAFGSSDFLADELLSTNAYGNTDLLLSACRIVGQEPVPVGIGFKPFADYTIDTITTAEATQYTVVLSVVPALLSLVAGVVVLVRRKNR